MCLSWGQLQMLSHDRGRWQDQVDNLCTSSHSVSISCNYDIYLQFLIHTSRLDLCSQLCFRAGQLVGQNFNIGHCMQTFLPNFIKPAILVDTFQVTRMEFDVVLKQFRLDNLILVFNEIYGNKGNNCCLADCINYESVWFKHGRMIDAIELCILILV